MTDTPPALGVDPKQFMPWGRWVIKKLTGHDKWLERIQSSSLENNRSLTTSTTSRISKQQALILGLQEQIEYLASLVTVSDQGSTFNSGTIANDGVVHYLSTPESLALSLTVNVPTGRAFLMYGCSEMTVQAGNGGAQGLMGFDLNDDAPGYTTRVYAGNSGDYLGSGASRGRAIDVTPGPVTFRARFAVYSGATAGTASVNFTNPWMSVQVIPALVA